jgi:hypothetical protein
VNQADKRAFAELLGGMMDLYGRKITPEAAGLWWGAFEAQALEAVRAAFSRYTQDPEQGRYPPTPAAVLGCLPASGGARIKADEAWAMALASFDEAATVCLTDEMLEAVSVAKTGWTSGDKVAARMAFKDAYERITGERRERGQAPVWTLSLGWDAERRATAAQEALRLGRMSAEQVRGHLPAPEPQGPAALVAGLLAGKVVAFPDSQDAVTRRRIAELRQAISGQAWKAPERDVRAEREEFEARKHAAVDALERMQTGREAG